MLRKLKKANVSIVEGKVYYKFDNLWDDAFAYVVPRTLWTRNLDKVVDLWADGHNQINNMEKVSVWSFNVTVTVTQPGGALKDSRIHEGDRSRHLAIDEEVTVTSLAICKLILVWCIARRVQDLTLIWIKNGQGCE
jgi:hypothetical protein